MNILVIENWPQTSLGQIRPALDEAGAAVDRRCMFAGDALPDTSEGYDGLIVLGGGQNALDDEGSPWFAQLLSTIRDFSGSGRAVLGVCLGAQLIARAHGGKNVIGSASEFGWQTVERTSDGADDPVFSGLPDTFPIFEWHDDTFSLPKEAVRLATNGAVPNQAFRIGRACYGTQFHFEADRTLVREWNGLLAHVIAGIRPDWPERFEEEAARHGPQADAAGAALVRRWIGVV